VIIVVLTAMANTAQSEDFSTTNVQVLYGANFHDPFFGYNTTDGKLTTVTLEHFGTWAYGDNYFFVDVSLVGYVDINGTDNHGTEINGQPQLLVDAGRIFGVSNILQVGVEWYFHHHHSVSSSVAQAVMKWTF